MSASQPEAKVLALPSKNPIPLSASQEQQVKRLYYERVRNLCRDEIIAFARCASGRTFSATWACRQQKLGMNGCMIACAGPDEEDRAREEYFALAPQRRAERELTERTKAEQEKFHREWWKSDARERAVKKE